MTAPRRGWSWGTGVLVAFGLFLAGILGMVALSMSEDVQLVTDRYYDNELRYQDRIQAMERANGMVTRVHMEPGSGCVLVRFPRLGSPDDVDGQVTLYRPANRADDRTLPLVLDTVWTQRIPTRMLAPGLWRVQVQWRLHGEEYYAEHPLILQ
jgi:nitrogen fixation protein FixH